MRYVSIVTVIVLCCASKCRAAEPAHWAFQAPIRKIIPVVANKRWVRNGIDHFVLSRLEKLRLSPSQPATRQTLIRRLSLDLLGLPPTPEEVAAFVDDARPDAYPRLVDRLLASPHYGERMAQDWLDAARYADTTGHAADVPRTMWLYRDWVISALNRNMPFDQFTIEQLAGDMLPNATESQRIATGFHRNSMQALGNNPRKEEFRIKGIVDRIDTTGRVWLGLTLACAECHDHKYDPVSTREYYQLFAIFNNVPHYGERFKVHGPRLKVLTPSQRRRWRQLQTRIAAAERELKDIESNRQPSERQAVWERDPQNFPIDGAGMLHRLHGKSRGTQSIAGSPWGKGDSLNFSGSRSIPLALRRDQITNELTISTWIKTRSKIADLVSAYDWKAGQRSFVFGIGGQGQEKCRPGQLYAWISSSADPFAGIELVGSRRINDGQWHHVAVVFSGRRVAQLYVDGKLDRAAKSYGSPPARIAYAKRKLVVAAGYDKSTTANAFFFRGALHDLRIYARAIHSMAVLGGASHTIRRALLITPKKRSDEQRKLLAAHYRQINPAMREVQSKIHKAREAEKTLQSQAVTAQVLEELKMPRRTYIHIRGNFEDRGARVQPRTPAFLPSMRPGLTVNRLSFARWLVSGRNPLTARVIVNRIWALHFGYGLVDTVDDFGLRGRAPTHPHLLAWLALRFVVSGWDVKALQREILTSATYRQSSRGRPELRKRDPQNRLLARAGRFRLSGEQIRDNALAISGLLDATIGGPSVYPLQPAGVGEFRDASAGKWKTNVGANLHRRALYTFWQRMSPYPSLTIFDAPSRERSCTRRSRTNTPLQALTLLNDPAYVKIAKSFAKRIIREAKTADDLGRLKFGFQLAVGRPPDRQEQAAFLQFARRQRQRTSADKREQQVWTLISQILLNLDETINRE